MRRLLLLGVAAVTAAIVATSAACRRTPVHIDPAACRGCNLLLITIDTLRLDRVDAFGGTRNLTPTLDRLAREGLILTRAYASAPLTLPSHTSILTAVSPPVHGVRANGIARLGPKLPTLATVLKSAGYRTGAFVGAFVLDARFGLTRGFDVYDDKYGERHEGDATEGAERTADEVAAPALGWIEGSSNQPSGVGGQPWFAWVHFYDPHEPYNAPEPWRSQHEPYDAEVAYVDATIGRLLSDLERAGQLGRTLVMVAADHGESLGEHGERTHGTFVYDVTMRVPWIIWAPKGTVAGAYGGLVRLIDLAPTALDLLGIGAPAEFEGRSVVGAARGTNAANATAYLEAMDANLTRNWAPLTAVVVNDHKLIDLPIPELYDLSADPAEAANRYSRDPTRARTLESLLRDLRSTLGARATGAEKTTLNAEARQRLQALGYTASSVDPQQRVYTEADDPKRLIPVSEALNGAMRAYNGGSRAEAMASVKTVMTNYPNFATAFGMYASMQRDGGDLQGAIKTLDGLAARGMADPRTLVVLADYLMESGNPARARAVLEAVVAAHPDLTDAYNSLGVLAMRQGQHDQAQAAFRKVLELDPTSATAYANMASDDLAARHLTPAVEALKQAVLLDPRNFDALYNLGMALDALGETKEARSYLERFVAAAPPARYARDLDRVRDLMAAKEK